jgi:hypothetical protein
MARASCCGFRSARHRQHPRQRDTIYVLGRRRDTPEDLAVFKSTDGGVMGGCHPGIALSPGMKDISSSIPSTLTPCS